MPEGSPELLPAGNAASMRRLDSAGGFRLLVPDAGSSGAVPA